MYNARWWLTSFFNGLHGGLVAFQQTSRTSFLTSLKVDLPHHACRGIIQFYVCFTIDILHHSFNVIIGIVFVGHDDYSLTCWDLDPVFVFWSLSTQIWWDSCCILEWLRGKARRKVAGSECECFGTLCALVSDAGTHDAKLFSCIYIHVSRPILWKRDVKLLPDCMWWQIFFRCRNLSRMHDLWPFVLSFDRRLLV